tara:strand:- start:1810 stop:2259 length:450 start_codon:yes stop_codon:yes gene_type:complete
MATYNNDGGTVGYNAQSKRPHLLSEVVDFSSTTNATSDVFQVLNIPAGAMVLNAGIEVLTADTAGNSGTLALDDSVNSVTYVTAASVASTGAMTSGDAVGEMFVTFVGADTLDVTIGTGAVNAVVRVWAIVMDLTEANTSVQKLTFSAA